MFENLSSRLGYTIYAPDRGGTLGPTNQQANPYFEVKVAHRVNYFLGYSLSAGRRSTLGLQFGITDNLDYYFVNWNADWNVIRNLGVRTSLLYENGTRTGTLPEQFSRFGADLILSRQITEKLTASLSYRFLVRQSNLPSSGYADNSILLNLAYRF